MFDFAECFTRSVRLVLPHTVQRGLAFTFDMVVSTLPVEGDVSVAERSIHRLLLGAHDLVDAGMLVFQGSMDAQGRPTIRVTGAGVLASGERLVATLESLALTPSGLSRGPLVVARGDCPVCAAPVILVHEPAEGFVLDMTMPFDPVHDALPRLPSAQGAVAWVCMPNNPTPGVFKRRLEQLGWNVVVFEVATAVHDAMRRFPDEQPALMVAQIFDPSTTQAVLEWFGLPVSARVPRVMGVTLGHPALEDASPAVQLHLLPFSPRDLAVLTAAQEPEFDLATLPQALVQGMAEPSVLVVDDNPVNQYVMGSMAEAMGYAVRHAENGQEAIDACRAERPSAVLMDVNMPIMDGIEATRTIRALQRSGELGPFPILGASADVTSDNEAACLAVGMDTFISKPLMIAELSAQLRRLCAHAPMGVAVTAN